MKSSALFSDCKKYRYILERRWSTKPLLNVVMLNPSTADETQDDPTIRRCMGFAVEEGFGGIVVTNLFAFLATDPSTLRGHYDPVGVLNDKHLVATARRRDVRAILLAWGSAGSYQDRGAKVMQLLIDFCEKRIYTLDTTFNKQPKHPLYLLKNTRFQLLVGRRKA